MPLFSKVAAISKKTNSSAPKSAYCLAKTTGSPASIRFTKLTPLTVLPFLISKQGTILFVSHDQDFVNKLATDIIELSVDGAKEYPGNYESYLYQKQQEEKTQFTTESSSKKISNNKKEVETPSVKKTTISDGDIKALERKIQKLEQDIAKTEHSFATLEYGSDQFDDAQKKLTRFKKELEAALREWEVLLS